jgi:hypothetical protein
VIFLLTSILSIPSAVLFNWYYFGESQKGISIKESDKYFFASYFLYLVETLLYYEGHWLFCLKYLTVSEVLASASGAKQVFSQGCIKASKVAFVIFLTALGVFIVV